MQRLMIISSDSHAAPPMADFRPYLEQQYHEEFDAFLIDYQKSGSRNFEEPALKHRLDPEEVDIWVQTVVKPGRLEGAAHLDDRRAQMAQEGVAAEVVFPDFGRPFEMVGSPAQASYLEKEADAEHITAGNRAYNRWLADFVQEAGELFAAMAPTDDWADVEGTIEALNWFRNAGFKGVVLPRFDPELPLYHPHYDPIWSAIVDLDLVANSHAPMSMTTNRPILTPGAPHPAAAMHIYRTEAQRFVHHILMHLIWGGVLERHPSLRVAFTEQGSAWTVGALSEMDYAYTGSYMRRDVREVIRLKPSEYFRRQCYLGASTFSRAEVAARHIIGVGQMMMGTDYPHHEGTLGGGHSTRDYLRATFGAERVPVDEARRMLGETAAKVFGFDFARVERGSRPGRAPTS